MDAAPTTAACLNCGAELSGRWCAQCGQRAVAVRPTVHDLVHEATHELAHLDGKIIRTAKLLLFKPGALTREFLEGKRVRSVTPIRIYLLCSLLFFGTLSLMPASRLRMSVTKEADAQLARAVQRVNQDPSLLGHAMETAFPKAMFILMPLFALITLGFYWRAERMYVPHFYSSVLYHAFVFVALTIFEVIGLTHTRWLIILVRLLILIALFVYLGAALRRVYGGSRWLTAAKIAGIITIYLGFVLMAMAAIAIVTLRKL
jgi:hypothetical protein